MITVSHKVDFKIIAQHPFGKHNTTLHKFYLMNRLCDNRYFSPDTLYSHPVM